MSLIEAFGWFFLIVLSVCFLISVVYVVSELFSNCLKKFIIKVVASSESDLRVEKTRISLEKQYKRPVTTDEASDYVGKHIDE